MGINKINCLYSGAGEPLHTPIAEARSGYAALLTETAHLIKGLSPSLEARRLEMTLGRIEESLASTRALESMPGIAESLGQLRLDLRSVYRRSASRVSESWQSPAMESARDTSVQEDAQRLIECGIDYHRAVHLAGIEYENRFAESLVGQHHGCRVLATTSGMGAITTALHWLAARIAEGEGGVVVDDGCYHETRFLVETIFRSRVRYLDLASIDAVASLREIKPSLVVFDSTRNSSTIRALPVTEIMRSVAEARSYLLIDSTSLVSAEPILVAAQESGVFSRTLVATSLAKMHQFGMDLVTAGALIYDAVLDDVFPGPKTFRTHLGLNISEDSAAILPAPSRSFLCQRASRMSRNVEVLASALRSAEADLSVMTAACWGEADLCVPYFNISVGEGDKVAWYRTFMSRAMECARRRSVSLVAGTSFGFDTTRIYLVESLIPSHRPFIRVSPGMESAYEVSLLAQALVEAAEGEVR